MATDHFKKTFIGLVDSLKGASDLGQVLNKVYPFYAFDHQSYTVLPRQLTISVIPGDSAEEEPFTNESTLTDILPTQIVIVCDTMIGDDSESYVSEDGYSMLDYEYLVIRALQDSSFWNVAGSHQGWMVQGIERDVLVVGANGEPEPDIRRFEITLLVDILLDRTDGPAR